MFKKCAYTLIVILAPLFSIAQETTEGPGTLNDRYRDIYNQAETYNAYKVIKINTLNTLWRNVQDSISTYKKEITEERQEIASLNSNISALDEKIDSLNVELEKIQKVSGSISIAGWLISKSIYNIIVWSIIAALLALIIVGYGSHTRNKQLYSHTRKELLELTEEFDTSRKTSQEKNIKLGRELQTERNTVEELKARLEAKR